MIGSKDRIKVMGKSIISSMKDSQTAARKALVGKDSDSGQKISDEAYAAMKQTNKELMDLRSTK